MNSVLLRATCLWLLCGATHAALAQDAPATDATAPPVKRIAAIVTVYHHNSHADMLVSRLLQTDTLDGQGRRPRLELVSLFVEQFPATDISRRLAHAHGFRLCATIQEALTLGTGKLAVDGVLLIAEHGKYSVSATGQTQFPKRRFFAQILDVMTLCGQFVPIFSDKHLGDNWADAKWVYDNARKHHIPLMAGSSLPVLYRSPARDVPRGAKLKEIVAISYHTLDAYGFHALEMVQTLVERRAGGETGIRQVRCLDGAAVWEAEKQGIYNPALLALALGRQERKVNQDRPLSEQVKAPVLWVIDYEDGLRANIFTLNYVVNQWAAAWSYQDRPETEAVLFATQEARPFMHFSLQLAGIETMFHTGRPAWPVERTLTTSGLLDALLLSRQAGGAALETPHLREGYVCDWNWQEPAPPPPDRPIFGQ